MNYQQNVESKIMETLKKNIVQLCTKGGITAVLAFIVVYFGGIFLKNVSQIQAQLANIRIELVKIQSTIITEEIVEKRIDSKIKLHEYHYHNKDMSGLK